MMTHIEILSFIEHACKAVQHEPRAVGKWKVLAIDGAAGVNKVFLGDAILPQHMNLFDGGLNRNDMRIIGVKGLETVLSSMNVDTVGRWDYNISFC